MALTLDHIKHDLQSIADDQGRININDAAILIFYAYQQGKIDLSKNRSANLDESIV